MFTLDEVAGAAISRRERRPGALFELRIRVA
jgi:hypothetical protein